MPGQRRAARISALEPGYRRRVPVLDPLTFADAFISSPLFPTHTVQAYGVVVGEAGTQLYSASWGESGTGPREEAGGWRRCRCWHKAEECAATRAGRGLRAVLQGAECGLALLSGHVPAQVQEGRDMFLAKGGRGGPQRCISAPTPSLPGPFSLSAPIHAPYVGKLLPKACHLEAKHRGVVEVQQLPQGEQHRRAVSALFQALTTLG